MSARELEPRIWVASLGDYVAARLFGRWIDADQSEEEITAEIEAMLASSPLPGAEEWAIFDAVDFGPVQISENEDLSAVSELGRGIAEHGVAFGHFAAYLGPSGYGDLDTFEDRYVGRFDSPTAFAEEMLEATGVDLEALGPEFLAPYIRVDLDAYARDLALDYYIAEDADGIYVFER